MVGGDKSFDYYVDYNTGSNFNNGRTGTTPYKDFTPFASMTLPTGSKIGVKAGTTYYQVGTVTGTNIKIKKWGTGARPTFDCRADIASSDWSKTAGRTNVYQASISLPEAQLYDTKLLGNFWLDDTMILQVNSLALCDSTPNSFYVTSTGGLTWDQLNPTLYFNPGVGITPQAAGARWRYSKRSHGLLVVGTGAVISDMRGIGNCHQDGSIKINGENAYVYNCVVEGGCRHSMLVSPNPISITTPIVENCQFLGARNDIDGAGSANGLVCFGSTVIGKTFVTKGNIFDGSGTPLFSGLDAHGADETHLLTSEKHTDSIFRNCSIGSLKSTTATVNNCLMTNCANGFTVGIGVTANISAMSGDTQQIAEIYNSSTLNFSNSTVRVSNLADAFIRGLDTAANATVNIADVTVTVTAAQSELATGSSPAYFVRLLKGSVNATRLTITNPLAKWTALFLVGASGGTSTVTMTGCKIPYGSLVVRNNTTYRTLAAMTTAGIDDGTSTYPAKSVIASDGFGVADTNLENVANWSVLDGSAAQYAIRSGKLAQIGTTLTAYRHASTLPLVSGFANGYVKGENAGAGNSGALPIALRVVDKSNWFAARWSATAYQLMKSISGTISQHTVTSGITPTVGDVVQIVAYNDLVALVVNNDAFFGSTANISTLQAQQKVGCIARSPAQNPALDNFEMGTFV